MKLVIITILTLSLISMSILESSGQIGGEFHCLLCGQNRDKSDQCEIPPSDETLGCFLGNICVAKIDSSGDKDRVLERTCKAKDSLSSEYIIDACQRVGDITYCACSTDRCDARLAGMKTDGRLQCYHCYDCGNTNGYLMDCPSLKSSYRAGDNRTYYCTTEGYGSLVRRSCGVDLPVDKYKLDDKCHKALDKGADMESTYCACKTNGCNNQKVATAFAVPKFEKTATGLLIITTLVVLSFV